MFYVPHFYYPITVYFTYTNVASNNYYIILREFDVRVLLNFINIMSLTSYIIITAMYILNIP